MNDTGMSTMHALRVSMRVRAMVSAPPEGHLRHLEVCDAPQAHAMLVQQRVAVFSAVARVLHHPRVLQHLLEAAGAILLLELEGLHAWLRRRGVSYACVTCTKIRPSCTFVYLSNVQEIRVSSYIIKKYEDIQVV